MTWGGFMIRRYRNPPEYRFAGTEEIVEAIEYEAANCQYFEPVEEADVEGRGLETYYGRHVIWAAYPGRVVEIPAANVLFMEGNIWNLAHAACIYEAIETGMRPILEAPAARVYRITAQSVKEARKYERVGELEYQLGMVSPWEKSDQGDYYAQLLDGNHRAAAALASGESSLFVYVGENTLGNVRKKDLL